MISLIMCSRDDARFAGASATYAKALAGTDHEVIRIPDARSMSEGYNRALLQAKGDPILLSHDDIELLSPDTFASRLLGHMEHFDVLGVAGTTRLMGPAWFNGGPPHLYGQLVHPHPDAGHYRVSLFGAPARSMGHMQAVDGVLMSVRRAVFERIRFDERYSGFHLYDVDFSFTAHLAGYRVGCAFDLDLYHHSAGAFRDPEWEKAAWAFMAKYEKQLAAPEFPVKWQGSVAKVNSLAEARRRLHPDHWDLLSQ